MWLPEVLVPAQTPLVDVRGPAQAGGPTVLGSDRPPLPRRLVGRTALQQDHAEGLDPGKAGRRSF